MAKYHAGMVAEEVASRVLKFTVLRFIKEFPAEKFYRDAKIGKLYEGTSTCIADDLQNDRLNHLIAPHLEVLCASR